MDLLLCELFLQVFHLDILSTSTERNRQRTLGVGYMGLHHLPRRRPDQLYSILALRLQTHQSFLADRRRHMASQQ